MNMQERDALKYKTRTCQQRNHIGQNFAILGHFWGSISNLGKI